jgi:hypothetical protein
MERIPDFVTILGQKWEIVWLDLIDGDVNVMGLCTPETRTINLKNGLNYDCAVEVLMHECWHCYCSTLPMPGKSKHEENLARFFAGIMLDLLKNNQPWWEDDEDLSSNQKPSETH